MLMQIVQESYSVPFVNPHKIDVSKCHDEEAKTIA